MQDTPGGHMEHEASLGVQPIGHMAHAPVAVSLLASCDHVPPTDRGARSQNIGGHVPGVEGAHGSPVQIVSARAEQACRTLLPFGHVLHGAHAPEEFPMHPIRHWLVPQVGQAVHTTSVL